METGQTGWESIRADGWGTWLDASRFDPFRGELVITSTRDEGGERSAVEMRFTDVGTLAYQTSLRHPLEKIEVTEIWGRRTEDGRLQVQVVLWSDSMTLEFTCSEAGVAVTRTGGAPRDPAVASTTDPSTSVPPGTDLEAVHEP